MKADFLMGTYKDSVSADKMYRDQVINMLSCTDPAWNGSFATSGNLNWWEGIGCSVYSGKVRSYVFFHRNKKTGTYDVVSRFEINR
jgi:hypothetical protein